MIRRHTLLAEGGLADAQMFIRIASGDRRFSFLLTQATAGAVVDWGDGVVETVYNSYDHTYAENGEYTIKINALPNASGFNRISIYNNWTGKGTGYLVRLDNFRTPELITYGLGAFYNCSNLEKVCDNFALPNSTTAERVFGNCSKLTHLPRRFSAPLATSANDMCSNCPALLDLPAGLNLANVTSAKNMLNSTQNLTGLPDGLTMPKCVDFNSFLKTSSWSSFLASLPAAFVNSLYSQVADGTTIDVQTMFHGRHALALPAAKLWGWQGERGVKLKYNGYTCYSNSSAPEAWRNADSVAKYQPTE